MAARSPAGAEWVVVRLSQVPEVKRVQVAERLIEEEGLVGVAMLQMQMAARFPTQDPKLKIRRTKLRFGRVRL